MLYSDDSVMVKYDRPLPSELSNLARAKRAELQDVASTARGFYNLHPQTQLPQTICSK